MSEPSGPRAWLTVVFGVVFVTTLTVWLFTAGTVVGLLTALAGAGLAVVAVVSAVIERRPGCVLVGVAWAGVGALLVAVVFGFAYLDASWTYLRGDSTQAVVRTCEDDCVARWQSHTGEVDLLLSADPGDRIRVRVLDDDAVYEGSLTTLMVASSGVAVLSPFVVAFAVVWLRRQATARHHPSGGDASSTASS